MDHYEIIIKGHLDPHRLEQFEGMTGVLLPSGETLLSGPVVDQAALHGLLTLIRDLGLSLLRVNRLDSQDSQNS